MKSLGSGPQIVVAVVDEACGQVLKLLRGTYRFEAAPPGVGVYDELRSTHQSMRPKHTKDS
jgi:hypothetical protein